MAETADRISSLSDDILRHILSFTTTKDAVTTSILSKRWSHLWRTVPILNFTNIKLLNNTNSIISFNLFVHSVLLSRIITGVSINTFHLDVAYANRKHLNSLIIPNLMAWLNVIVRRQLNYLNLKLSFNDNNENYPFCKRPKLPESIFNCKTLIVLNLNCFRINGSSFTDIEFGFPSLKKLNLTNIRFHDVENFMLLLAGCPVLEDLKVCRVLFDVENDSCQAAERLNLSKLIRADITYYCCFFPIKALSNSEFLRIQIVGCITIYEIPIFHNLTHLVINNISFELLQFLDRFPKLRNLVIYENRQTEWDTEFESEEESWVVPKFIPQCFSLNLRTCTIRDFGILDLRHDIMLARYILNNAGVLKIMTIWSDMEKLEIERELSSCPRASATCQLSIY